MVDIWMSNRRGSRWWLWSESRCLWSIDIVVPIVGHERGVGDVVHEAIVVGHVGVAVVVRVSHAWGMRKYL